MKLREVLLEAEKRLLEAGVENAAYDARILLQEAYGITSAELLMQLDRTLCPGATGGSEPAEITGCPGDCGGLLTFRQNISQRARRVPLQQIVGHAGFMGLDFKVNHHVLIPRQDTETLVETVLDREKNADISVLDLCTGSGCIGISLKYYGKYREVTASDIDRDAVHVAMRNAAILHTPLTILESDLFEDLPGSYDVIVSNPPYIPTKDIEELMPEVREHDPKKALDGGTDGLDFYRRIVSGAPARLTPGGRLYLEIGAEEGAAVAGLLREAGFAEIEILKDLSGLDRVVLGQLPKAAVQS